mmetsp:Transcript_114795/g.256216  ORF Transcript_114795/g.256216 Transcript_114795/m.256216 type:complete len:272 (-) Transcript_114795:149-964(-)
MPGEDVVKKLVCAPAPIVLRCLQRVAMHTRRDTIRIHVLEAPVQLLEERAQGGSALPALLHKDGRLRWARLGDIRTHLLLRIRHSIEHILKILVVIWLLTTVHLAQEDAEGVDIGRTCACGAAKQLGCHPERCAAAADFLLLGEAEVCYLCTESGINEHIGSLEVAVHDHRLGSMQETHTLRYITEDGQHELALDDDGFIVQQVVQGAMVHQLHDEHRLAPPGNHRPHHCRDARMPELGEQAHLHDEIALQTRVRPAAAAVAALGSAYIPT